MTSDDHSNRVAAEPSHNTEARDEHCGHIGKVLSKLLLGLNRRLAVEIVKKTCQTEYVSHVSCETEARQMCVYACVF